MKAFREMTDNDDTVGEILFAIEMLIRQVEWTVELGGETPADQEAAEFLESCMEDMEHSWSDFIAAALTMLSYGWSLHEIIYKLRDGTESKFDDGKVGWASFSYQPQEVWQEWVYNDRGQVDAFRWTADGKKGEIPAEKFVHFRTTTARGANGRSALRNAYRPWYFKKRLEEIATIGADRDLNGLPVMGIPADDILDDGAFFKEAKELVTRIHRDEQWGVVQPLEYDENGKDLYTFDVIRADGSSSIGAVKELIVMFAQGIAGVVLADFIRLGRDSIGSRALAEPKQQLFQKALQGWVDGMAELLNRTAVPRLFALNDFTLESLPVLVPEEIEDIELDDLGAFIKDTAQAGMVWFPTEEDPIFDQIRQRAGFDAAPEGTQTLSDTETQVEFDEVTKTWEEKE